MLSIIMPTGYEWAAQWTRQCGHLNRTGEARDTTNRPVKKGDTLFKIDPEPFQDQVRGLEGELAAARKDLSRATALYGKQVARERSLDQTKAKVAELQAKLDDARFQLERMGRGDARRRSYSQGRSRLISLMRGMFVGTAPTVAAWVMRVSSECLFLRRHWVIETDETSALCPVSGNPGTTI